MLDALVQDVRFAIRAMRTSPGFTAVAVLSLALGIGANTAIFTLIDAVMLKSLPVSHPEELLQVMLGKDSNLAYPNPLWEQVRDRQDVFSGIFAYTRWSFNLSTGGEVRHANGLYVSGQYFDALGVHAALGRTLSPSDDRRGCPGAAVLTDGFWQREYGGRSEILGKAISLDGHPMEIVGVSQPGFTGVEVGSAADILIPVCAEQILHGDANYLDSRSFPGLLQVVIARPRAGVSASQVSARLQVLAPAIFRAAAPQNLRPEELDRFLQSAFYVAPASNGSSYLRRQYRQSLMVLMWIVAVVLLIACANVANLLLARGAARQREIAIRLALGCGRGRLVRQLLTESLLLSGLGALLGLVFARAGTRLLVGFLDVSLDLRPDVRTFAFTAAIAVLTGLLFGIAPAWRGTRVQPQAAMKSNSRAGSEGSRFGLGKVLVAGQVALSLLLVAGAGLMLSSFWNLATVDAGFDRDRVLLVSVDLRNGHYPKDQRQPAFQQMLEKLRALPGVRSASSSNLLPICHCAFRNEIVIEGRNAQSLDDRMIYLNQVSDGYFATMGTALVAGRDFTSRDTVSSPRVAVINQTMARRFFSSTSPLGQTYRPKAGGRVGGPVEIVGVVKDAKYGSLRDEVPPTAYIAWSQDPLKIQYGPGPFSYFELRASVASPAALIPAVKTAIGEVNRDVSIEFTTLAEKVNGSIEQEQLLATLSGLFGGLALLLATIGLYGVMSYNMARRRHEIGIRLALGAPQVRVVRMILGEVTTVLTVGLVLGMGLTLATTRVLASFLFDVKPNDPLTLGLAVGTLSALAVLAGYLPGRKASRLDPMVVLREE